jgi:integrase
MELARLAGLEPATAGLEIQRKYGLLLDFLNSVDGLLTDATPFCYIPNHATRSHMSRKPKLKMPVTKESGIPIRYLPNRKKKPWMVDILRNNVRTRACYATEEEARQAAMRASGDMVSEGLQALALSRDQRLDAGRALRVLDGLTTLEGAARFFVDHSAKGSAGKPAREVVADLLRAKRAANRRPLTIIDVEHRLSRFVETFGDRPLGTITLHDLESWLAGLAVGPVTRDNFRRAVGGLFNYAMKRGLCDRNPALGLAKSGRDERMPRILTTKQAQGLLDAAVTHAPEMVPYFAIGLFAGLRPKNELAGLDWSNIDMKAKTIMVDPATAKRRRSRFVKMSANLRGWLLHHGATGTVFYSRRLFRKVVEKAGIGEWSPDVMRHTFASYHLAAHGDANATALQLGHAGAPGVLFDHYRALAKPGAARAFWKIAPKEGAVVAFRKNATA